MRSITVIILVVPRNMRPPPDKNTRGIKVSRTWKYLGISDQTDVLLAARDHTLSEALIWVANSKHEVRRGVEKIGSLVLAKSR